MENFYLSIILVQLYACITGGLVFDGPVIQPSSLRVRTPVGEIIGKLKTIQFDGRQYYVKEFLGIPYAEPANGENRFRKPVPKAVFTAPFNALDYGPVCLQKRAFVGQGITMSEDCLSLNIFVPLMNGAKKLPVMVYIHGGGFIGGSSIITPGDTLGVFGQVIVVTINYRLGHLGFLKTGEKFGNFGLWDQHFAIRWVNKNIASFGGDIGRITVFGESAGSESVNYQVLFPGNKGLFQRAIAQSMGITSGRAFKPDAYAAGIFRNFTAEARCLGAQATVMTCLRNKTTNEIASMLNSPSLNYTDIFPNLDSDFVPMHPQYMLSSNTAMNTSLDMFYSVDFMMGSCSIDGAMYLTGWAQKLNITDFELFKVPRTMYENEIIPGELAYIFTNLHTIPQLFKDITVFQYTNWTKPNDDLARNRLLVDLYTDSRMFVPMLTNIQLHASGHKGRTYMYEFSTPPTSPSSPLPSWLNGPTQALHADDVYFVFGFSDAMMQWSNITGKIQVSDEDIRRSKDVMSLWANFAKTGNPNTPTTVLQLPWPEYDITSQSYLDITPTLTAASVKQHIAGTRMAFWTKLLPSLLNHNT